MLSLALANNEQFDPDCVRVVNLNACQVRGADEKTKVGSRVEMRVLLPVENRKKLKKHYSNMHKQKKIDKSGDRVVQVLFVRV